jgi:AmmeMemoRadiSam system protein A
MATDLGPALLALARNAIAQALGLPAVPAPQHPRLAVPGATFVTLRQGDDLRGCIGSLEAFRALQDDVEANARAAAFRDPRFAPLAREEFAITATEVSLLSASEPLAAGSERDALARLRPGVDGVILKCGRHRATFLPQVWEQLPEPQAFLAALKHKAGLPAGFWRGDLRLARYTVEKFAEHTPAGATP